MGSPSRHILAINHSMGHQTRITGNEVLFRVVYLEFSAGDYPMGA